MPPNPIGIDEILEAYQRVIFYQVQQINSLKAIIAELEEKEEIPNAPTQ